MEQNDQDILQFLDENNLDWITLWQKALNKKANNADNIAFIVSPSNKQTLPKKTVSK
jgi:hypothetical protein